MWEYFHIVEISKLSLLNMIDWLIDLMKNLQWIKRFSETLLLLSIQKNPNKRINIYLHIWLEQIYKKIWVTMNNQPIVVVIK